MKVRFGVAVLAALVAAVGAAASAPVASAGLTCPAENAKRHFMPWLDVLEYRLAAGGSLESTSGWKLSNGAKLVSGNEPYYLNSPEDRHSLYLPSGSSATSPWSCVSIDSLVMRFFAVNSGSLLSNIDVDLLYRTSSGKVKTIGGISVVTGLTHASWAPTLPVVIELDTLAADLLTLDLNMTEVAFRFRPSGGLLTNGKWRIDDLYVDPILAGW